MRAFPSYLRIFAGFFLVRDFSCYALGLSVSRYIPRENLFQISTTRKSALPLRVLGQFKRPSLFAPIALIMSTVVLSST